MLVDDRLNYESFLSTLSSEQWKRVGIKRRSGVAAPLFSVYSSKSIGIGELPDISLLVDWCKVTGMSLIQLLPLNDVGFNFRPYDAQSSFAIDPMYLSLNELIGIDISLYNNELKKIKSAFPTGVKRVNYGIKSAKLSLLWKIFEDRSLENVGAFTDFIKNNSFWLEDYAVFKVIKERHGEVSWEGWGEGLKHRNNDTLCSFKEANKGRVLFFKWLQWQLFEQFKAAKKYASDRDVLLVGDLPFLVSRDSADVWSHQDYFKLLLFAGAPPDMLYSNGQRWGMPPYNWEEIAKNEYDYVVEKLKYAQNFYNMYRIDHVVGIFRVWTIPLSEPLENAGLAGVFDPKEEALWEEHGRKLLSAMINNTTMLACAEDLGVVPDCSNKVLSELGIPGIDVQRWKRDWGKTYDFSGPLTYRKNSIAVIATHDMSSLKAWWEFEAGTVDECLIKRKCKEKDLPYDAIKNRLFDSSASLHGRLRWKKEINCSDAVDFAGLYKDTFDEKDKFLNFLDIEKPENNLPSKFIKSALEKITASASIFSIQLLHDWLSLDTLFDEDPWETRINFPGTLSERNWRLAMPISLEDMISIPVNTIISSINKQGNRT
ncbi:MAG: 4-alpha-glucanotransferase [Candidatus Omnitrophica bacterium CG1_02_44_16]|nr:MAG: 4-alpha-glucanotransferase [Candidatus Omnitrophica bacterium CG1_02_44_16]